MQILLTVHYDAVKIYNVILLLISFYLEKIFSYQISKYKKYYDKSPINNSSKILTETFGQH